MKVLLRNPGVTTSVAAVAVLVVGGFAGLPLLWTLLLSLALVVLGATLVNGTYVLRRLLLIIPTLFLVTAFTFCLQNRRGSQARPRVHPARPRCHGGRGRADHGRSSTSTSRCSGATCCG